MICKLLNSGIQKIYSKYNVLPMRVQWILRKVSRYGQLLKELVQNFCLCAFIFLPYWCVLSFGCMHTVLNFGVINKFLRLLGYVSHGDGDVSSTKSGNRGARRNALYISELKAPSPPVAAVDVVCSSVYFGCWGRIAAAQSTRNTVITSVVRRDHRNSSFFVCTLHFYDG